MSLRSFENDGKVLIRFVAFSSTPLNGYYRFDDVLQLFSLPDEAPKPEYLWGDHPFVIEYSFNKLDLDELRKVREENKLDDQSFPIDEHTSSQFNFSKQAEITSILSVVSRYLINNEDSGRRWVRCNTEGEWRSEFSGLGYYWKGLIDYDANFTAADLNEIPCLDGDKYYGRDGIVTEPFSLCADTSQLLNKYFALEDEKKEAFLTACVMFSQAASTWEKSHSLAYIGLVSSLEALIDYEHKGVKPKRCDECKKPDFEVTKKFREFARKYGADDETFIKYASRIYGRRSDIGHRGKLMSKDVAGRVTPLIDDMSDHRQLMHLVKIARICLINWLVQA